MKYKNGYAMCFNEWLFDKAIKSELNLLLLISSLCAKEGYCWATNEHFSEEFEIDEVSVSRKIKKLADLGHIKIHYEKRGAEVIKREIRLTKMLTDDIQKSQSTINKNVKENIIIDNNIINNNNISSPFSEKKEDTDKNLKIVNLKIDQNSSQEDKIIKSFHELFCEVRKNGDFEIKNKTLLGQKVVSWREDLEKIMRIDKKSKEDLLEVYKFLKTGRDDFWRNTVSSLSGIRRNWDKIQDKIRLESLYADKSKETAKKQEENSTVFKGNIKKITKS
jgi:hypothetical protein